MPFFRLGKRSQQYNVANKDLFVIPIELLTNEAIECTLFASSLGQECLANVCSKIGLANGEYFGLLFRNARRGVDQWVDLGRPLKKQLDKWAGGGEEPVRLLFRLQFFVPNFNFLADEITRYHYFCAMKGLVVEGRIGCSREDAILLASFSLQAEFGDYTPERHTVEYLNSFALFPMAMWAVASAATRDLLVECAIAAYRNLEGVPTAVAEIYYICEAQQREGGHGQEGFPARDLDTGQEVCLGVYIRGIFVVKMGGEGGGRKHNHHHHQSYHHREVEFFRWHDIANLMHNKKVFIVERSCPVAAGNGTSSEVVLQNSRKNYATLDPDFALAVWRCAVEQHQLFMKGHSFHSWQQANQSAQIQDQNLISSGEGDYATHLLPHPPPQQMSNTSSFPFLSNDFFLGYEHFLAQKNALAAQIAPTLAAATAAAASAAAAAAAASSITAAGMDSSSSLEPPNGHYGNIQQYHLHHHHHQQHHPDPRSSVSTGSLYETIKSSGSVSSGSKQPKTTSAIDGNGNGTITPSSSSNVPTPKPRSSTEPIELHHIALQNCSSNPKISESGHHHLLHPPGPALTYTQKKLQSKTGTASAAINNNSSSHQLNSQINSTNGTSTISPKIMSSRNAPGTASAAAATAAPIYENQQQLQHSTDLTFEQRKKLLPPYRSPPDYGEFIKQRAAKAVAAASSGNSGVSGTTTIASLSQSMGSIPSRLASQFAGGGGAGVSGRVVGTSVSSSSLVGSNGVGPRGGGGVVQHSASMMSVPLALQQQQQQQKQLQQQLLYQQYQQYQTKAAGQQKQQQQSNLKHANSAVAYSSSSKPNIHHLEVHPNHPYHHRGSLPPPELPPRTASLLNSPPPSSHHLSNSNLLYPSSPQSKVGGGMFTASSPELNNLHSLLHFQKQQNQNQQQQNRNSTNQHVMQMVQQQQQQNHQQYYHQNHHQNQYHHQLPNQNQFPPLQPNSTARPEVFASHKSRGDDGFDQLLLMSKHRPCFTSVPDLTFSNSNSSEQQQYQHGSFGSQTGLAKPDHHHQQQQQQSNKQKLQSNGFLSNGKVNSSSSSKGSFFAAFPLGKNPMRIFRSQHTTGSVPNLAASSAYQVQHQQQQQSNLQLHQQYNNRNSNSNAAVPKTRRSTEALNYWVGGFNAPPQSSNYHHHQQRSNSIAVLEQLPGRQQMPFSSYSIANRIDEAPELAAAAAAAAALAKPSNDDLQNSSSTTTTTSPTPTTGTSSPSSSVPTGLPTNVYSLQGHQQQQQLQQNHQQNHQQNLQQQSQQQQQPKQQVIYANVGGSQQQQQQQQQESQQLPKTSHLHNHNHHHQQQQQQTPNGNAVSSFQQQQQITGVSDPRAAEAVANYISCVQSSSSSARVITSTPTTSSAITTTTININNNNSNGNGITQPPSASRANPIPTSISSRIIVFNSENFHDQDFTREFELLPRMNPEAKFTTASLPENVLRNRFRDILPYEENR